MLEYHYTDEIYHHGIKGQKWGVRRYQNEDGTLTEAGKKRIKENLSEIRKIQREARKIEEEQEMRYFDEMMWETDPDATERVNDDAIRYAKKKYREYCESALSKLGGLTLSEVEAYDERSAKKGEVIAIVGAILAAFGGCALVAIKEGSFN